MKPSVFSVLFLALACTQAPSQSAHPRTGDAIVLSVGSPRNDPPPVTDTLEIEVVTKNDKGKKVYRKLPRINVPGLDETMGNKAKAKAIADAINNDPVVGPQVTATVNKHVVTITANAPEHLGMFRVTIPHNNSLQKTRGVPIPDPGTPQGGEPVYEFTIGRCIMIGTPHGVDGVIPPNAQSEIEVGTDRYVAIRYPTAGEDLGALLQDMCDELVANGINAVMENPATIKVQLEAADGMFRWGCSDKGIMQYAEVGQSEFGN